MPAKEGAVHSGSRTTSIGPGLVAVVWELRVGVVEVGDHDEPVADQDPRNAIELHHVPNAVLHRRTLEHTEHEDHAKIRNEDRISLAFLEEGRVGWRSMGLVC